MNNILISLSLGLNLILTTLVVYTFMNIPYNMDAVRDTYLKDIKWAYDRGCTTGTDYPQQYRENGPGFNVNSVTNWCNDRNQEMSDVYMNGAYHLGRK